VRPLLTVEGDRIQLSALEDREAGGAYLSWMRDPEVTRFLEARLADYDEDRLRRYIQAENENPNSVLFGIFRKSDVQLIGTLKLSKIQQHHQNCEIGLMIGDKAEWGKGCATEAIALACRYAFETLRLHRVSAGCYSTNPASARAFAKAGFEFEGRLREERLTAVGWVDTLLLGRINSSSSTKLKAGSP
jgi:ribosomal-protein-alanine N-acetyltransferase